MLIAAIVTGLIALFCGVGGIIWYMKDELSSVPYALWTLFFVFGLGWLICFLWSLNLQFGTSKLTGYIYSSDTTGGYTTGHLRFSENAGADNQPSFCVKADTKVGEQITELAGSGKKVTVTIPPYFYFANNPFACGTTDTKIVEVQ